jgi:hypothetical protein
MAHSPASSVTKKHRPSSRTPIVSTGHFFVMPEASSASHTSKFVMLVWSSLTKLKNLTSGSSAVGKRNTA